MKSRTFVSIICADEQAARQAQATIRERLAILADIRGNEVLVPVPEHKGLGVSLNQLRGMVNYFKIDMFDSEYQNGVEIRNWYCLA